mmetsp:Transcript_10069/g.22627  ORF Transcript_10069/g.22627 Transcript_10069/m.22627 type:complete len:305 (-) Transcript_10069:282-1196(-)
MARMSNPATEWHWCHVGTIGFKQQSIKRNFSNNILDVARILEGDNPSETEKQVLLEMPKQALRQVQRAREAVDVNFVIRFQGLLHQFQRVLFCQPCMYDQRHLQVRSQLQLSLEDLCLLLPQPFILHNALRVLVKVVEAALSPSNCLGMVHEAYKLLLNLIVPISCVERVNAKCTEHISVLHEGGAIVKRPCTTTNIDAAVKTLLRTLKGTKPILVALEAVLGDRFQVFLSIRLAVCDSLLRFLEICLLLLRQEGQDLVKMAMRVHIRYLRPFRRRRSLELGTILCRDLSLARTACTSGAADSS